MVTIIQALFLYKLTFVSTPTGMCAVYEDNGNTQAIYYVHTDYQGSWLAISDGTGGVTNRYSYDAWGRPRDPQTWALKTIGVIAPLSDLANMQPRFDRGYTGHEMLCGFGLINMNGRLYDPYLQRFLSPDPVVQNPYNSQNYNRYSYCINNPLKYTDPSGYSLWDIVADVVTLGGYSATKASYQATIYSAKETYQFTKWSDNQVNLQTAWLITLPSSCIDAINNGWSHLDPYNKGSISNNAYQINNGLFQGSPKQILSRLTWESPQTLTGLTVSQFYNYFGDVSSVNFFHGATVVNHYSDMKIFGQGGGCFTLGSYINAEHDATPADILHEYGHYLQSQDVGPKYLTNYALPSLINGSETPDQQTHNAFWVEQDADKRALSYFGDSHWDYYQYYIIGDPKNPYGTQYDNYNNYYGPSLFEKFLKWLTY